MVDKSYDRGRVRPRRAAIFIQPSRLRHHGTAKIALLYVTLETQSAVCGECQIISRFVEGPFLDIENPNESHSEQIQLPLRLHLIVTVILCFTLLVKCTYVTMLLKVTGNLINEIKVKSFCL